MERITYQDLMDAERHMLDERDWYTVDAYFDLLEEFVDQDPVEKGT